MCVATPSAAEGLAAADESAAFIPILGNTAATDLGLMKEINDLQIFDPQDPEPETRAALPDAVDTGNIWDKIRSSRRVPLTVNAAVEEQKKRYITDKIWINRLLQRSSLYLQFIVNRLEARGLPLDLALLPAIESGFRPDANSPLNAAGLWQIVPLTAAEIGLKKNTWYDGRSDLVHSTRAALDYLSYLNAEFHGDWELTLAAYNAGPGRVKNALRKNLQADIAGDFWSLKLPRETREYLPKFTALVDLVRQQPFSPLELPDISTQAVLTQVDVGQRISLDRAAELAEMPYDELRKLNAGLLHAVTAPKGPHRVLLPSERVDTLRQNLGRSDRTNLYSMPRTHVVVAGDSVSTIAQLYGIKQKLLRELNQLQGDKILLGQKLAVLDSRAIDESPDNHELSYTIKRGDTLSEIAQKFNVSLADITFSSGGPAVDKILIPGKKLRIHVPAKDEKG